MVNNAEPKQEEHVPNRVPFKPRKLLGWRVEMDEKVSPEVALLDKIHKVLLPLDSKIEHSLYVGTEGQMRADLSYLRGLLDEMRVAVEIVLDSERVFV